MAEYLPEFIESIESQTVQQSELQVIMVDDGSTDDSGEILRRWRDRRPDLVTVLSKPNGGQSSARNLGLDHATGRWVSFPDPDDVLVPNYLAEVAAFVAKHPETVMAATRFVLFDEVTGLQRRHPNDRRFTKRNRLRNLDFDSGHSHGSAPAAFFRLAEIERTGLRFDEDIRPNFEDGYFCCRYLLHAGPPLVGFLPDAIYLYRKRLSKNSTLDLSWADPRRMTTVPELAYIPLAREAIELRGSMPGWLQSILLYELSWYFRTEDSLPSVQTANRGEVADRFIELLRTLVGYFDPDVIQSYTDQRLTPTLRDILLHGLSDADWHSPFVVVDRFDARQELMRVRYRFAHDLPHEQYYVDGAVREPVHAKVRSIDYFGHSLLKERIVWLPTGTLAVQLDGAYVEPGLREPAQPVRFLDGARMQRYLVPESLQAPAAESLSFEDRALIRAARSDAVRRMFSEAWVLIDRIDNADDSAEILFRYLRKRRRDVNAWFVVEAGSPDYRRLRKQGYKRIVPYGSRRWKLLMLNAAHLVSSHADVPVTHPEEIMRLTGGRRTWRVDFLQHGVMKDDLSRWFNPKNFDLFVTSTPEEQASVVADGTGYAYTTREAVMTGLPRFDQVRKAGLAVPAEKRDLILLAPTWRQWLTTDLDRAAGTSSATAAAFTQSEFACEWRALASSEVLRDYARKHGLEIAVLLHPNLQRVADQFDVPSHVRKLTFDGEKARTYFARSRVMVTDYSSMAFNAAYMDRPLVYFQFDRERVLYGGHLGRAGYFDYERDGFGPVADSADAAVKQILDGLSNGPGPLPKYQARIDATFPVRDGKCTERTYRAIERSTRRVKRVSAAKSVAAQATAGIPTPDEELDPVDPATAALVEKTIEQVSADDR